MLYSEYLNNKKIYQEEGARLLLERKHACLFFKPGKGKTYPTIDALRDVAEEIKQTQKRDARVLILSTASAIREMWNVEIVPQKILPENTILMTITQAIQDETKKQLLRIAWDIVIVDECHRIKSNSTKIGKLVYQLTKKAPFAWGLSGTPRGNSDLDIFCQFHNLNISEWGNISYTSFVDNFCTVENKFYGQRFFKVPTGIRKEYRVGWDRNIAMYSYRADYDENDDMPPLNTNVVELPFEKSKEYKLAEEGAINLPDYSTTMAKLAATIKMHQIANGYVYVEIDNVKSSKRLSKNIKLDWLREYAETHNKFVVVYRFIEDMEMIKEMLKTTNSTYTEDTNDFKTKDINVLLLQCARCESFNLQMCKDIVFYTLDYSFINYDQMLHRLWRMGQEKETTVNILVFKGSVEEKIWYAVKNKQKLADLFMAIKGA